MNAKDMYDLYHTSHQKDWFAPVVMEHVQLKDTMSFTISRSDKKIMGFDVVSVNVYEFVYGFASLIPSLSATFPAESHEEAYNDALSYIRKTFSIDLAQQASV